MYRISLPFTDAVLLLTPPGSELSGFMQAVWLVLLGLIPVALVLLARYELRLVRRSTALVLLTFRLTVLGTLLFLLGFQPIVSRTETEELPGRVLIAVDRSESMDVADPQRPAVEKLRLARALKAAVDLCPDALLDQWIRDYETKGGPEWVAGRELPNDPARREHLTEERRRQHDQVCGRIDSLSRTQVGHKILAAEGVGLLQAIRKKHQIELLGFAQEAWDVKPDQLDELFRPGTELKEKADAPSPFSGTDLRLPLSRALNHPGTDDAKILGVVLLTDGRHNWGPSPVAKAIELGQQGIPIYPIPLGGRQAPPDVALAGIKAPPAVFKDADIPIEARVKVSGLPQQDIVVELQRSGHPPLQEHLRHDGTDRYHTVRFPVKMEQIGAQTLTVTAQPVKGEIRIDNNSRPVVINVADDKAKVLLVDGEARWEYHYLANALVRDPAMQLQTVVFQQPRLGKIAEDELRQANFPVLTLPADPDAFAAYDCLILGDVSPSQLPPAERLRLEKYVADRGGTLVIVAGKRWMPLAFVPNDGTTSRPGAKGETDPLLKLLPVVEPQAVPLVRGFAVTLTHEGQLTPFLQMDAAPDKSLSIWADLPPHYWGLIGRAKPGATALAYLADDQIAADRTDPGPPEKDQALIVRQNYGFGRVLYVGLESTWRWRYKVGDTYHHRFWGQVIRWAATDKPLVAGNEFVRFGTHDPVYPQGQEVELVVRLGDRLPPLGTGALTGARVLRVTGDGKEEAVALVSLTRKEAQARVLEGRLRDLPAGNYRMELAMPELADKVAGLRAAFTVTPSDSDEMIELAANWPLLEELAAKSGGRVFAPEHATELVDLLASQVVTRPRYSERRLWEWWPTLLVLLLLLTLEWVGRKWLGLP
jgi:hypothetical protein